MRCRKCKEKAIIKIRAHNIALCSKHFLEFFVERVRKSIRDFRMIEKGERVLVAVSGGKDSLSLWDVLVRLGIKADGIHVNSGIRGYSETIQKRAERFAHENGLRLHIIHVKDVLGYTIPDASKKVKRPACSLCGLTRRHVMNTFARGNGYTAIATGHNLDDEASNLLSNMVKNQWGYVVRQSPKLPSEDGLVKKIKPMIYLSEREIAVYAILRGIGVPEEKCPYSKEATSIVYKEAINHIENFSPGTKHRFITEFLRKRKNIFKTSCKPEQELGRCPECGTPTTTGGLCSFCRIKEKLKKEASA